MKKIKQITVPRLLIFFSLMVAGKIYAQYCVPQHSWPQLETIINGVELEDIVNTENGISVEDFGYTDFTALSANLTAGSGYTIYFDNKSFQYNYSAWIDYNQNYEFEPEEILGTIVLTGVQSGDITFTVPADAMNGDTRMRVRAVHEPFGPWSNSNDPCLPFLQGDAEDYTIHIDGGLNENIRIEKIASPVSALGLADEYIQVDLFNSGNSPIADIEISYSINGGTPVSEIITDAIPPNSSYTHVFDSPGDFNALGCYSLQVFLYHPADEMNSDDSLEIPVCNLDYVTGTKKWLVHSNIDGGDEVLAGDPFYNTSNTTCMNTVFGDGNWTQAYFETVNADELFSDSSCFVFMDGSYNHVVPLDSFLNANHQLIENWVAAGGHLFLNSSGSEYEGDHFYVNYGFDDTKIVMSYQVTDIKKQTGTTHPIYDGPYTPVGTSFSGFYASNAAINGRNLDTLAHENLDGVLFGAPHLDIPVLAEKQWGIGKVILSTWAPAQLIDPADKNMNLRQNILSYLSDCVFEVPFDAGVSAFEEPIDACGLTDHEEISITMHNYGSSSVSNIPVAYRINAGTEINEIAPLTIEPGDEASYIFSTTADFSSPGVYDLEIYTVLADDIDHLNDTLFSIVNSAYSPEVELGDILNVCDEIILDAGNAGSDYIWSTGESTQTILVTETGTYSVTVTNILSGCSSTDAVTVNVTLTPVADFGYTLSGNTIICVNNSTGAGTYLWDFGDGAFSTESDPTHAYAAPGIYTVTLTVTNDCGVSMAVFEITISNIKVQTIDGGNIKIYPNPVSSILIVEIDNLSGQNLHVDLFGLDGKKVFEADGIFVDTADKLQIDLSEFSGNYFLLHIIDGGTSYSIPIEVL